MIRLGKNDVDRVIAATEQGMGRAETAALVGCSKSTVTRVRRMHGLAKPWTPLTDEQLTRAEQLLDDGASFAEVARTIGTTASAICKRFPGRGWSHQECGLWTRVLMEVGNV